MEEFEFHRADDKPALVAISTPEALNTVKTALAEMGYKVHVVDNHPQFETRYNQFNYHVVFIEENFAGSNSSTIRACAWCRSCPWASGVTRFFS